MIRWHDSLLAHHAYASHFAQRLDHLVSEYCDSTPWKITHGKRGVGEKGLRPWETAANGDGEELCKYNAIDAHLTALVWQRMQADLAPERHVYEHDLRLAAVCREMQWEGIGVDTTRRDELSEACWRERHRLQRQMRLACAWNEFRPGKLDHVREVLFQRLGGRPTLLTSRDLPSTSNLVLEGLRADDTDLGRFAAALLRWRVVGKIKSTYLDVVVTNPSTGRMHYNWKPFGTVSGRLSCRLQSCPRYSPDAVEDRVREIYIPRRGNVFVYFDVSQAEMRLAAYISADPAFMASCGADVHVGNAKAVFPEVAAKGWLDGDAIKDPTRGKPFRDIAKNLGFAIAYGAEADKVFTTLRAKGFGVTYRAVEVILAKLRAAYKVYYRYVDDNLAAVRRDGFMRSPVLGRIRWLGWYPKPTDVSNYPVQSALADIVNMRMIEAAEVMPKGVTLSAQIHDACIYDVPRRLAGEVQRIIADMWAKPVSLKGGDLVLPIDLKVGERWSEL